MSKKVTIKDIAVLVGVSTATISHYLNGNYGKMSETTKKSIENAIELTNYRPSAVAKGLATNEFRIIGVVIADITNPFISTVMKGVNDACRENGYAVIFTNSDNDIRMEMKNINELRQQNVSGIILDSVSADNPLVKTLDNSDTVMVDRQSKEVAIDTVVSDNEASTFRFINYMKKQKYNQIFFVSLPLTGISTREQRYIGFKKALSLVNDDNLIILNGESDQLKKKLQNIIQTKQGKVGFFTVNGPTLLRFMELMNSMNFRYPQDYGIGSYEDLDWMKILKPGITCIRQDSYGIGKSATNHLLNKIKSKSYQELARTIEIPTELIYRDSL
ncbi:LacI family DNA-binding transcriptional regulator [Secundilactobacillus mixtipabuli]|uniref:Transcriptional regulator n=1 Tax=Secundilactobacillus mixtipabuli TaxID=1435342 RepID=A0A1Z5I9P8_9LACO|nr:LacI family DNA-binding transcriptional regulator [Secundilactobacillus mixtipabuli]GAW98512.1 transcriptional regulator [Secundilactobacillus mixtipabuli]